MDNIHFVEGQGLMDGERAICPFHPLLEAVEEITEENGQLSYSYFISIETLDGTRKERKSVNNLKHVNFFELFGIPYSHLGPRERRMITYYLEQQYKPEMVIKKKRVCKTGLSDSTIGTFVFDRNLVFTTDSVGTICSNDIPVLLDADYEKAAPAEEKTIQYIEKLLSLMPTVSDILFSMTLFAILKPLFHSAGIAIDFAGSIVGKHQTYKTTMANLICTYSENQVFSFIQDSNRNILKAISLYGGHMIVLDDFHKLSNSTDRQKQIKIADTYVRKTDGAFVLLTGEFLDGPASMFDRLIQLSTKEIDPEEKVALSEALYFLQDNKQILTHFYADFARKAYTDYEKTKAMIRKSIDSQKSFGKGRVDENVKKLIAAFEVFSDYFFNGHFKEWKNRFLTNIETVKKESNYQMTLIKLRENGINWLNEVYKVLYLIKKGAIEDSSFSEHEFVYIRSIDLALNLSITIYGRHGHQGDVPIGKIKKKLAELNLLHRDSEKDFTVKRKNGIRYIAIDYFELKRLIWPS